jgi:RNA-binding protein
MELTSKQRAQLRGMANTLDTILQVGKDGIGENLIKQADDALEARELIKGRVLDNNLEFDARSAAGALSKATRSEVVQVIGTKFVLYRESHSKPRDKRIALVKTKPAKKTPAAEK